MAGALAVICNKYCSDRLHNSVTGLYYILGNGILTPVWSLFVQRTAYPVYSYGLFLYYLLIAFLFFMMNSLMSFSFQFMPAAMAGILIYTAIPVSYVLDFLVFKTKVGYLEIIGVAVIVLTNVTVGLIEFCGCNN